MENLNKKLIGVTLDYAKIYLNDKGYDSSYSVTSGGKDKEILDEPYVVRVKIKDNKVKVLLSHFKTMI